VRGIKPRRRPRAATITRIVITTDTATTLTTEPDPALKTSFLIPRFTLETVMPEQYPYQQFGGQFPPPPPVKKNRHWVRWTLVGVVVFVVAAGVGSAASSGKKQAARVATTHTEPSTSAPAAPERTPETTSEAPPPPATPDPAGTVTGTCAYELSSDLDNYETHAADLNAEVDVENTGNVGIVLTVTVTYPQLAHPSIVMTKKVNVPYGQTVTVPFTRPITQSQVSRLQDWQSGHDFDDGCKYKGTIVDTYGPAH